MVTTSAQLLDQVQSVATIAAVEAAPDRYAAQLVAELPPATGLAELEAGDAMLAAALGQIDVMIARVMRIHLDHALVDDTSIAPPTRRVFASTIVDYASNLELLAQRVRDVATRTRAPDPALTTQLVVDAARRTLALRDAVRAGVLAAIRNRAAACFPEADRRARDPKLENAERTRWSAARRDLEAQVTDPERVGSAPMPARLAALPTQIDEPDPGPEVTFADMIEFD